MPLNLDLMSVAEKAALRALDQVGSFSRARLAAEGQVRNVLAADTALTPAFRAVILDRLRKQRMTQLLQTAAERILTESGEAPQDVLKAYAQALIDDGRLEAAAALLQRALLTFQSGDR